MIDTSPAVPTVPAPTAPAPTVTPQVEPHTKASVSEREAATMAEWAREDVAKGKLTPEQAAKIFDDLGTPIDQRVTPAETRSDEQKLLDAHFPPATPDEFVIRYGVAGQELPMTPELKQFDGMARGWLAAAGFDRGLGNSVVNQIEKVTQHTQHMTPNELEDYGYREFAKLEKIYGSTLDDRLREAGRMVHELDAKQPGLKNLLSGHGIGDNALIASMLIQQSQRFWARRKGR